MNTLQWTPVLLLGLVMIFGAAVQSVVGFGLAVIGAPIIVIVYPELVPGALLVTSLAPPAIELWRGARDIDRRNLGWALGGRVLMTPVGVALVAVVSTDAIAVLVGVMVLLAVAASASRFQVRAEPRLSFASGLVTGLSGTAASVGGPFFGLVLQRERPTRIRSTLALFFVVGACVALTGLAIGGQLHRYQVIAGLVWIPFTLVGMALSVPVRRRVSPEQARPLVLTLATIAGVVVIVRTMLP